MQIGGSRTKIDGTDGVNNKSIKNRVNNIVNFIKYDVEGDWLDRINIIINELKEDLKSVNVIVSHNVDFHIKTVQAEAVRYNLPLDFSNFIIIDTINFYHSYGFTKLKELASKLSIKNISETNENNVELIKNVFLKLYVKFQKSITT